MKKLYLMVLASMVLFSCRENSTDVEDNSPGKFFPLTEGNYWIYESTVLDPDGNPSTVPFTDSIVITGTEIIQNKPAFTAVTFRNGAEIERACFSTENSAIMMFARALKPLLPADSADCWSKFGYKWIGLVDFSKTDFSYRDSAEGDVYQSLREVVDSVTHEITYEIIHGSTQWLLNINAHAKPNESVTVNGMTFSARPFELSGKRIYKLVTPDNAQFSRDDDSGFEYSDNNRTMTANNFSLSLWYTKDVGLVQSVGKLMMGNKLQYYLKRKLLRYHVN